jgi:hypothetical protein
MTQRMSSSRQGTALVLFATVLMAGTAVAGIASFYFAASGSSASNIQTAPQVAVAVQPIGNAETVTQIMCQQAADGGDPTVQNFVCPYTDASQQLGSGSVATGNIAQVSPEQNLNIIADGSAQSTPNTLPQGNGPYGNYGDLSAPLEDCGT